MLLPAIAAPGIVMMPGGSGESRGLNKSWPRQNGRARSA